MVYKSGTDVTYDHTPGSKLSHAIKTMPRWKWRLLGVGLVMGCIGLVGQASAHFRNAAQPAVQRTNSTVPVTGPVNNSVNSSGNNPANSSGSTFKPPGSSGFVSGSPESPASPDQTVHQSPGTVDAPPAATVPFLTPVMTRVGFSLAVGVIVGLIFRTFMKMAFTFTTLAVGAAMALSYFHVINIDLSSVRESSAHATSWLMDQADHLKAALFRTLPSSTSAGIGFLLGFKRR